jgi:hypothetical protein
MLNYKNFEFMGVLWMEELLNPIIGKYRNDTGAGE